MKNNETKSYNVIQMTDAELRRALDFLEGDEVLLLGGDEPKSGIISGIRLSFKKQFLIYQVRCQDENGGVKFVNSRGDQIRFIRHIDEK